ncbi:MAG: ABC transporter ATP-binding protein [Oscillospiraceae bacterium]
MAEQILLMDNITKIYPNGFVANKDVTLSVNKGEIHALLGENGAGKTTLMKVLFGIEKPEQGKIYIRGEEVNINNSLEAIDLGVGMVHQHFMLLPSLTVAENIVLGMEPKKGMFLDLKKAVEITKEVSKKYNLIVDPKEKVSNLPVGLKQKVEILKALVRGAKVLILDEPTAVLTPQETQELFVELKNLKEKGYTIIFISHKLNEIKEICDRITVLRHGKTVAVEEVKNVTEQDISRLMVGRDVVLTIDKDIATPKEKVLDVKNLIVKGENKNKINDISFSIRSGEILGIAGVEGNGQRELSEIISGLMRFNYGEITVNGINIKGKKIKEIRELGVSHVSEDRMTYGCSANSSIKDNIISERYYKKDYNKGILLDSKKINEESDSLIKDFLIKCDDRDQEVRMLSGGNIQKVVVAREFSGKPKLVISNQPTRGIDVGATSFIREKLVELRDKGSAVLLISADLNEVFELCDSLIVMYEGEISAYIEDTKSIDEMQLGEYMLGVKKQTKEEIERVCHNETGNE